MYVISSRKKFWDDERFSKKKRDQIRKFNSKNWQNWKPMTRGVFKQSIKGKKVLLLCHGYNADAHDVMKAYRLIEAKQLRPAGYFDVVVGYTWPGGDRPWAYGDAKARVSPAAGRFVKLLQMILAECSELGVMSHSMGCKISLVAHRRLFDMGFRGKCASHWQFLMAASVDDESIEQGERYFNATQFCDATYVFHSKEDFTLAFWYRWGERISGGGFDPALGWRGPENPQAISPKTKVINCKHVVKSHGGYKKTPQVHAYILNELTGVTPAPQFYTLR